mgnify:CR=1 FL=1
MYNLNNKLNEQQRLNIICSKLVNKLMKDGKKTISEKIVHDTFRNLEKTHNVDPHHTLLIAIENVSPFIEVRSIRLGGTKHPVPVPVKPKRQIGLALKWIIDSARKSSGNKMSEKLSNEILLASQEKGNSVKRCTELHKLAMANRAYSGFRW